MISMTRGIEANLWVSALAYAVLPVVAAGIATAPATMPEKTRA
jgi:hypothetical protein